MLCFHYGSKIGKHHDFAIFVISYHDVLEGDELWKIYHRLTMILLFHLIWLSNTRVNCKASMRRLCGKGNCTAAVANVNKTKAVLYIKLPNSSRN